MTLAEHPAAVEDAAMCSSIRIQCLLGVARAQLALSEAMLCIQAADTVLQHHPTTVEALCVRAAARTLRTPSLAP